MTSADSAVAESSGRQVASPCRGAHLASARRRINTRRIEEVNLVDPEACAHTVQLFVEAVPMGAARRNIVNEPEVCSRGVPSTAEPVPDDR
jgi:hypothetical protein